MRKVSKNPKETAEVAKVLFGQILKRTKAEKGALVIGLSGNLGAGKTAFTKAVAKYLGVKGTVNSPTFVIMKKYPVKIAGYKFLYHFDAYRLLHEKEIVHLGWEEIIGNEEHLVVVEWPENISKVMPKHARKISIDIGEGDERLFQLK